MSIKQLEKRFEKKVEKLALAIAKILTRRLETEDLCILDKLTDDLLEWHFKDLQKELGYIFMIDGRNSFRKIIRFLFKALDDDSDAGYSIEELPSVSISMNNYLNKNLYEKEKYNTLRYQKMYSCSRQNVKSAQA